MAERMKAIVAAVVQCETDCPVPRQACPPVERWSANEAVQRVSDHAIARARLLAEEGHSARAQLAFRPVGRKAVA